VVFLTVDLTLHSNIARLLLEVRSIPHLGTMESGNASNGRNEDTVAGRSIIGSGEWGKTVCRKHTLKDGNGS
jgi:hypothetical protein